MMSYGCTYMNILFRQRKNHTEETRNYLLKHREKLIFVDEVGDYLSQKGDVNAGVQKFMVTMNMRSPVRNSFKDNHFTLLGFITADGCAVMCAITIAALKLRVTDVTGFNPIVEGYG
jgi:hypothetical protein